MFFVHFHKFEVRAAPKSWSKYTTAAPFFILDAINLICMDVQVCVMQQQYSLVPMRIVPLGRDLDFG